MVFSHLRRTDITEVLDVLDNVDQGPIIEQAFHDLSREFPMDPLVSELDRLHRASPPDDVPLAIPQSVRDPCGHRPLELLVGRFGLPDDLLSPYLDPAEAVWSSSLSISKWY